MTIYLTIYDKYLHTVFLNHIYNYNLIIVLSTNSNYTHQTLCVYILVRGTHTLYVSVDLVFVFPLYKYIWKIARCPALLMSSYLNNDEK